MKTTTRTTRSQKRKGSTLLVVMGTATVLLICGTAISFMTSQMSKSVIFYRDRGQALSIAEAGVSDMVAKLRTNYQMWINNSNTMAFSTGTTTVQASAQTNGNILIDSTAWVGDVEVRTVMETLGTSTDPRDLAWGFGEGLLADGVVVMETGAPEIHGDAHANSTFNLVNGDIDGNLSLWRTPLY